MGILKRLKLIVVLVVLGVIALVACNPDEPDLEPTAQELAFELLEGTWRPGIVILDGIDITSNYVGFSLEFTEHTYAAMNAQNLLIGGTWDWTDEVATRINLIEEGKELVIIALTEHLLIFTFTLNRVGGAVNGINGNYRITLEK